MFFLHNSVLWWLETSLRLIDLNGRRILEVGAYDVNGSPREVVGRLFKPELYQGVDIRPGPGVDQVLAAAALGYAGHDFDAVISTEMLEHALDWRGAINGMKRALAPGGWLFLTARSPGFGRHDHPGDYWRFTSWDMGRIFDDLLFVSVVEDEMYPGVFVKGQRQEGPWIPRDLSEIRVAGAPL
jgi:SAM-dependent methyltransferase